MNAYGFVNYILFFHDKSFFLCYDRKKEKTKRNEGENYVEKLNLARIGFLLKSRRIELNLSIRELSVKSGVAAGTISQIETGKTSPNLVSVYSLCECLNFPISALFIQDDSDRVKLVRKNERTSFVRNTSNQETILESLITKGDSRMWGGIINMPAGTRIPVGIIFMVERNSSLSWKVALLSILSK